VDWSGLAWHQGHATVHEQLPLAVWGATARPLKSVARTAENLSLPPFLTRKSWLVARATSTYVRNFNYSIDQPRSVVFVVRSAEEKTNTEATIQAEVPLEWRSVFAVELEDGA
jgi:hypothetical protein